MEYIWLFVAPFAGFPGGIFTSFEDAQAWISRHGLTGTLTLYPLNIGVYDWAVEQSLFVPRKPHEFTPEFIARFSSASMEHYHYEAGAGPITREGPTAVGSAGAALSGEGSGVWVFVGPGADFPSGAFCDREAAERWIRSRELPGRLLFCPAGSQGDATPDVPCEVFIPESPSPPGHGA